MVENKWVTGVMHPRSSTARPWKMVVGVGELLSYWFSLTFQGLFLLNFGRVSYDPYKWSYFTLQKALVFGPTLAVTYVRKLTGADRLMVVAPPPTASNSLATVCGRGTTGLQVPQFEGETETTYGVVTTIRRNTLKIGLISCPPLPIRRWISIEFPQFFKWFLWGPLHGNRLPLLGLPGSFPSRRYRAAAA